MPYVGVDAAICVDAAIDVHTEAQERRMRHDIIDDAYGAKLSILAFREDNPHIRALEEYRKKSS